MDGLEDEVRRALTSERWALDPETVPMDAVRRGIRRRRRRRAVATALTAVVVLAGGTALAATTLGADDDAHIRIPAHSPTPVPTVDGSAVPWAPLPVYDAANPQLLA